MKKTKKFLASLVIMGMVATMVPLNVLAATGVTTDRIGGADRYQTANAVADKIVSPTTAILAPAENDNLVDALAAAPLAGTKSPILLTQSNTLTAATKTELAKLGVTKVYVVGAISKTVVDQVSAMGITVTTLQGADRIATAAMISSKLTTAPAGSFVVGYNALADALSVASYAAANNYSILVANPDGSLPVSEATYKGAKVYTVGGPKLVADIAGATRLADTDRFATNKVVLETLGYTYNKVYVANGTQAHLVDSLVASSLAALDGAPIVLTDTFTGGDATAAAIGTKLADNAVVVALGGDQVVTNETLAKVTKIDYTYTVTDGKAQITRYTGDGGAIAIPSTLGGVPVISIGYDAFFYCTGLTSISIPQGVTSIGDGAFAFCTGLISITIPKGVTNVSSYVFYYCPNLTTINFNSATTTIYDDSYTIPDTTKIIGYASSTAKDYATKYGNTFEVIPETLAALMDRIHT